MNYNTYKVKLKMSTDNDNGLIVYIKNLERHLKWTSFSLGEWKIFEDIYILAWFKHYILHVSIEISYGTL